MNANELRIGNIVTYHGETDMDCVLDAQDIFNIATKYMHNDEIHSPVKLTDKILLKYGFVIKDHWALLPDFCLGFITNDANYQIEINIAGVDKWVVKDIQFLHQLQNIYFALTGEELTIKTI